MINYKNKWEPYSLNEDFWREVLVGRTIKEVVFHEDGIEKIVFDNGEYLFAVAYNNGPGTFSIKLVPEV